MSRIKKVVFQHLYELEKGEKGKSLNRIEERYAITENEGVTVLHLKSETPAAYFKEMDAATEKALQTVRELAEE